MGETGVIFEACQSTSLGCQEPKHSATHSSWRFETATLCCTESLEDGAGTVSISSVRSRLMHIEQWGCSSETGGSRGRSVTVLQEGSTSCPQGRTQSAPTGALEQKKSSHGCCPWAKAMPASPNPAGEPPLRSYNGAGTCYRFFV